MRAMVVTRLDDQHADLLADYRGVPDPELVARRGLFVAEGRRVVRRLLLDSGLRVRSVLVTDSACAALRDVLDETPDLPVFVVPQAVMNDMTGFNIHRGCLALGERPAARDWRELARGARRLILLERVGDADNVGSIFRNAAAFGADGVLIGPACADPLYRKAIRTSMAAALVVPFASIEPWPGALCELRQSGTMVIGLTPAHDARVLAEVTAGIGHRPVALLVGHEGDGLSHEALHACDHLARIPMAAGTDSLNVATAAAVALYELSRLGERFGGQGRR